MINAAIKEKKLEPNHKSTEPAPKEALHDGWRRRRRHRYIERRLLRAA